MDKMKEFLLKNKGCPMTPAATKQLLVKLIELLSEQEENPVIKIGQYIADENYNFKWVENIPENYSGNSLFIGDDGFYYIESYVDGNVVGSIEISMNGVNKLNADIGTPVNVYGEDANGNLVKGSPSSMTLLGSGLVFTGTDGHLSATFTNIDMTKITQKTLLIFTYANCFVLGMLSQTGEGRVVGNLVYDDIGNSVLAKVKFKLSENNILVTTTASISFNTPPTAYLFAFSVI